MMTYVAFPERMSAVLPPIGAARCSCADQHQHYHETTIAKLWSESPRCGMSPDLEFSNRSHHDKHGSHVPPGPSSA